MASHHPFDWRGHRLELLGAKAVWDPAQRLLLLADLHLGKAETFQAHGIPLPSDGDRGTLNALLDLAHHWRPREVVVLGDLIHSRLGLTAELRQKLAALPALLGCPLSLIGGNHERGSWLAGLSQQASLQRGPLWLSHIPEQAPAGADERLNLCGHLHPVALVGSGNAGCGCPASASMPARHGCCCPPSASSPAAIPATLACPAGWWPTVPLWPGRLKACGPSNAPHHRG